MKTVYTEEPYVREASMINTDENMVVRTVRMTPDQAETWLNEKQFPHQREIRESQIERLVSEMTLDRFIPTPICVGVVGGKEYLLDGQHRLLSGWRIGKTYTYPTVYHYGITMDRAKQIYARLDRGSTRTHAQCIKPLVSEDDLGLTNYQVTLTAQAASVIYNKFEPTMSKRERVLQQSSDERYSRVKEWAPIAIRVFETLTGKPSKLVKPIQNKAALAVVFVTFKYCPELAVEFWDTVAENSGLVRGTPEHTMVDILLLRNLASQRSKGGCVRNDALTARIISNCWNAKFNDLPYSFPRMPDASKPICILGTPFRG